jgi:K+ transporter
MANMAVDSWLPHRFAALSERLTSQNGIVLMGLSAFILILYTGGSVSALVVMYSINVFVSFTLSQIGMIRYFLRRRQTDPNWLRHLNVHLIGFLLCATILTIIIMEKFAEGGWLTILITSALIILCFLIHTHYRKVRRGIAQLDEMLLDLPITGPANTGSLDPNGQTAVQLVNGYNGFGIHTLLSIITTFPGTYRNIIFVSVAVVDSGSFKGAAEVNALEEAVRNGLIKYVNLAQRLGVAADYRVAVATDVVDEAVTLCTAISKEYPRVTVFTGQLTFRLEAFYHKWLHNETAFAIQRRLQWEGITTVIMPIRVKV